MFKSRSVRSKPAALSGAAPSVIALGSGSKGLRGTVVQVGFGDRCEPSGLGDGELERRLLEMGFVEGARVEILHEGAIGRDPIAVKLDDMRVALRRREAAAILVRLGGAAVNDDLTPSLQAAE